MRILNPVVGPAAHLTAFEVPQFAHCCRVRAHAIGDDCLGPSVPLQRLLQKRQGRSLSALLRDVAFEDLTFVIDRSPQIVTLSIDPHEDLIKVPAPVVKTLHSADPLSPDVSSEHRTEPVPPQAHRLVTYVDTAFEQQVFHIPQRRRKPHIHKHREPNDPGRRVEIAEWTGWFARSRHGSALPSPAHFSIRCVCLDSTPVDT